MNTAPRSPVFTFVEAPRRERRVPLPALLPQVASVAAELRARFAPGEVIGLIFRSEPIIVMAWLAALHAGLRPLIMQYPTRKQSRLYWLDSVSHTIERAGLAGILCDDYSAGLGAAERAPAVLVLPPLEAIPAASANLPATLLPESFAILQLSSGTTGFRKAIEFHSDALRRHVDDYNAALGLDPARDRIVSWLPLYHDMG